MVIITLNPHFSTFNSHPSTLNLLLLSAQNVDVELHVFVYGAVPTEHCCTLLQLLRLLLRCAGIIGKSLTYSLSHILCVQRIEVIADVATHFRQRCKACEERRLAETHSLHYRQTETFRHRREQKALTTAQKRRFLLARYLAHNGDVLQL